jgi:hypothetical protein
VVLDIEARAAEIANSRSYFDNITEFNRLQEIRAHIDERNSHNTKCRCKIRRPDAERCLEQKPRTGVEQLKKTAIEDDTGGITLTPFDR